MKFSELCELIHVTPVSDFEIHDIQMDSRLIQENDIFIALEGALTDGHKYIPSAIEKGAKAVFAQHQVECEVPVYIMEDEKQMVGDLAYYFYGEPCKDMYIIGVTGTNGKTTTTTLIYNALLKMGKRCGLIGTNGLYYPEGFIPLANTTPDALLLQRYFKTLKDMDIQTVVMEVSSHAMVLKRVAHVPYQMAVFTNLSQDHLDFHKDMEDYFNAKKQLFEQLPETSFAIVNSDDEATCAKLLASTKAKTSTYGITNEATYRASHVSLEMEATQFDVDDVHIHSDLLSIANVYNMLAVYSVLKALGYEKEKIGEVISSLEHINGRMEKVYNGEYIALVDYAHSPDSIRNALNFLSQLKKGRLIALVGCGGDRDKTKRPKMSNVACKYADLAILTSDNPRTEDPDAIIKDMLEGLNYENYCVIVNRREAIETAIKMAQPGDVIAVLGKGHEDYQIIGTTKYHFSDKEEILNAIAKGDIHA